MDCPVCQIPMIVFEFREIELDYCPVCFGVWFDSGEIELLLEKTGFDLQKLALGFTSPSRPVSEAKRRCPLCDKLMEKVNPSGEQVVVDRCPNGDGIWFDAGEVIEALKSGEKSGTDSNEKADAALRDFFKAALNKSIEEK